MKYRIITIISFIGSAVISLLGGWDKSLQTLIIFMTIDWLTGGILLPVVFQKSPKSQNGALERTLPKSDDIILCSGRRTVRLPDGYRICS